MKFHYVTPLVAAAGAAVAIIAAPAALATDSGDQSCTTAPGVGTVCSSPGNVQINDSTPVQFGPQYLYWEVGGYGYGGGHVGGHR